MNENSKFDVTEPVTDTVTTVANTNTNTTTTAVTTTAAIITNPSLLQPKPQWNLELFEYLKKVPTT
jgi:hypothetical protein